MMTYFPHQLRNRFIPQFIKQALVHIGWLRELRTSILVAALGRLCYNAIFKDMAYKQMMNRTLFSILVCLMFPAYVLAHCSNVCASCVNPNTYPQKAMCTSCRSNYALVGYSCYSCDNCQLYSICGACPPSTSDTPHLYALIFGTIAGVIFLCVLIIFIYYQYCRGISPVHDLAAHQHSAIELAVPSDLKWERSERKIDGGQNCAICLDGSVSLQTKCGHLYHPKCIWEWCSKRESTCPLCKSKEMEPIRLYCGNCSSSFIDVRINTVPNLLKEGNCRNCQFCKEENIV